MQAAGGGRRPCSDAGGRRPCSDAGGRRPCTAGLRTLPLREDLAKRFKLPKASARMQSLFTTGQISTPCRNIKEFTVSNLSKHARIMLFKNITKKKKVSRKGVNVDSLPFLNFCLKMMETYVCLCLAMCR